MRIERLEANLTRRLDEPLPGSVAQLRLAPRPRRGWQPGHFPGDCRPSAGLLLAYPDGDESIIVLTERAAALPQHAGQVSLPGGAVEEEETIAEAALREAREEIDLDPTEVRVLGCLTPLHIPVSGFILHPVLAVAASRPRLRPSDGEVARILEVPLRRLADPRCWEVELLKIGPERYEVPYFEIEGAKLWGATAMVLAEFIDTAGLEPFSPLG